MKSIYYFKKIVFYALTVFLVLILKVPLLLGHYEDYVRENKNDLKDLFNTHLATNDIDKNTEFLIGLYCALKHDDKQAFGWIQKAANKKHPKAQTLLGLMYLEGKATEINYKKALLLFRKAAAEDEEEAAVQLGLAYVKGTGVEQDYREALKWFYISSKNNYPQGLHNLGYMYYTGTGVTKNYYIAHIYFKEAAKKGLMNSVMNLGVMYADGQGVKKNLVESYKWFYIANVYGMDNADKAISMVEKDLSKEHIINAKNSAIEWIDTYEANFEFKKRGNK